MKTWRRKTWILARYFELAVPMVFMAYAVTILTQFWRRGMSFGLMTGTLLGLIYMGMLREIVEETWRWQALDWLANARHRISADEAMNLQCEVEDAELRVGRIGPWVAAIAVAVLSCLEISIWTAVARLIVLLTVAVLWATHVLMVRLRVLGELAEL